ncbi:hypothetical protein K3495_g15962 [Podosphaera aphanis]|nr:hypothetical protein K3495_g15962 [Podosphaera aphanis]
MSTAFHPETDGQTERCNAVMEQYLRSYVSYQQTDWVKWLPMAEFASNNQVSVSTKASPFYSNYGFHTRFTTTLTPPTKTLSSIDAKDFAKTMTELHKYLRSNIRSAQDQQEEAVNSRRRPSPNYRVGDLVFLSAKNIRTTRNSQKLDWRKLGPYPITGIISPYAYKLQLPKSMKIHPVFHVSLLEPVSVDPVPGQSQPPPPPVIVDGEEEYQVEVIYDSRINGHKRLEYLVKWVGENDTTWEPAENLDDTIAVDQFHERYAHKPGPIAKVPSPQPRRSSRLNRGATFTD